MGMPLRGTHVSARRQSSHTPEFGRPRNEPPDTFVRRGAHLENAEQSVVFSMTRGILEPLAGIVVFLASFSFLEKCLRLVADGLRRTHCQRRITFAVALAVRVTLTVLIVLLASSTCPKGSYVAVGLNCKRHQCHILTIAVSLADLVPLAVLVVLLTSCPCLERCLRTVASGFRRHGNRHILRSAIPQTLLGAIARFVVFLAPLALLQRKVRHIGAGIHGRRRNCHIFAIAVSRSLLDAASRLVVLPASLTLLRWRLYRGCNLRCVWRYRDGVA